MLQGRPRLEENVDRLIDVKNRPMTTQRMDMHFRQKTTVSPGRAASMMAWGVSPGLITCSVAPKCPNQ